MKTITEKKRIETRLKTLRTILDGDGLEDATQKHRDEYKRLLARKIELVQLLGYSE